MINRWTAAPIWFERRLEPIVVVTVTAIALALWFRLVDNGIWRLHHTVGVGIVAPFQLLWMAARYQLGAAFTAKATAQSLVTTGLYRHLRHPIYVFAEGISIGISVFTYSPVFAAVSLMLMPLQVRRARRENRVLEAAYGDEYREYAHRTRF